jgi:hypothetical protein
VVSNYIQKRADSKTNLEAYNSKIVKNFTNLRIYSHYGHFWFEMIIEFKVSGGEVILLTTHRNYDAIDANAFQGRPWRAGAL